MYPIVLSLHNQLRWVVHAAAIDAVHRALAGWLGRKPWTPASAGAGRLFTITLDVQFLVGILLYGVLSPITRAAFADMGAAMGQRDIRFFVAEHTVTMILALAFAHIGKALAPKAATDAGKWRRAAIWYGASLLLILGGMPWWRPLLRFAA